MPELADFEKQFNLPKIDQEELIQLIKMASVLSDQLHKVFVRIEIGMHQLKSPIPRPLAYAVRQLHFSSEDVMREHRYAFELGSPSAASSIDPSGTAYLEAARGTDRSKQG